jgi:hypothetical protein
MLIRLLPKNLKIVRFDEPIRYRMRRFRQICFNVPRNIHRSLWAVAGTSPPLPTNISTDFILLSYGNFSCLFFSNQPLDS